MGNDVLGKKEIIAKIMVQLQQDLSVYQSSVNIARESAIHSDSKSEGKFDTRGLEVAYLADAQAKRIIEIQRVMTEISRLDVQKYDENSAIGLSALVQLQTRGKKHWFFLTNSGGGITISVEDRTIQIVTPQSPLGKELLGKVVGDEIELFLGKDRQVHEIISVL